jgi:hypothetical protein
LKTLRLAVCTGAALGLGWLVACASVPSDARIGIDAPSSSEEQFGPVADFLEHRCGSLDCHGTIGRNFRIWGCEGMRLEGTDIPECFPTLGGNPTTPDEHQATYRALVGLEPAVMSYVLDHHADPALLTFIRKQRGIEAHKGGKLVVPGDEQDHCITSWLGGSTDTTACACVTPPVLGATPVDPKLCPPGTSPQSGLPIFPPLDASTE